MGIAKATCDEGPWEKGECDAKARKENDKKDNDKKDKNHNNNEKDQLTAKFCREYEETAKEKNEALTPYCHWSTRKSYSSDCWIKLHAEKDKIKLVHEQILGNLPAALKKEYGCWAGAVEKDRGVCKENGKPDPAAWLKSSTLWAAEFIKGSKCEDVAQEVFAETRRNIGGKL